MKWCLNGKNPPVSSWRKRSEEWNVSFEGVSFSAFKLSLLYSRGRFVNGVTRSFIQFSFQIVFSSLMWSVLHIRKLFSPKDLSPTNLSHQNYFKLQNENIVKCIKKSGQRKFHPALKILFKRMFFFFALHFKE